MKSYRQPKKIKNLWNNSELLKNNISELQTSEKIIDKNVKNRFLDTNKKIISLDSGLIDCIVFEESIKEDLWIEDWKEMKNYPIYIEGDPTQYFVPFDFNLLDKEENNQVISGTVWSGDKPYPGFENWEDSFYTFWTGGYPYVVSKILDKSFQDHYIKVRSIFSIQAPANFYGSCGGTSYWGITSVAIENPDVYLKELGIEKTILFQTISSGSIFSFTSGESGGIFYRREGYIAITLKISFSDVGNRYIRYYIGTNFVPPIDPLFVHIIGINNINSNLNSIIKSNFPTEWNSSADVTVQEINMSYSMEINSDTIWTPPIPIPARTAEWSIEFQIDSIAFIEESPEEKKKHFIWEWNTQIPKVDIRLLPYLKNSSFLNIPEQYLYLMELLEDSEKGDLTKTLYNIISDIEGETNPYIKSVILKFLIKLSLLEDHPEIPIEDFKARFLLGLKNPKKMI